LRPWSATWCKRRHDTGRGTGPHPARPMASGTSASPLTLEADQMAVGCDLPCSWCVNAAFRPSMTGACAKCKGVFRALARVLPSQQQPGSEGGPRALGQPKRVPGSGPMTLESCVWLPWPPPVSSNLQPRSCSSERVGGFVSIAFFLRFFPPEFRV
jgi:hypothetical protein